MTGLPLLARYPELEEAIPRMPLGSFPTPVERLRGFDPADNLWIKRDDLSSPLYGGNKVRKLEFILADALRRGCRELVTMGGIGTNHGLACAIFCRAAGLRCRLLLFHQPVNRYVKQNLLLFRHYGAEILYRKGMLRAGLGLLVLQRLTHPRAYVLEAGGSSALGTVGFVNAAFELKEQIDAGLLPEPRYIFCPLGSNGTMAGLSLGARLAGLSTRVIGVRVTVDALGPIPIATPGTVAGLMRRTHRLLRARCRRIPRVAPEPQTVIGQYVGGGYGFATEECRRAMHLMRERWGIVLDPTYTAKTFAAVCDFLGSPGRGGEPVLYWHTYNSVDLSAQVRTMDSRDLAPELRRIVETEVEEAV